MYGINEVNKMEQFIIDCLDRRMSLRDVATKYNMNVDEVFDRYLKAKSKYSNEQINEVLNNVYYN